MFRHFSRIGRRAAGLVFVALLALASATPSTAATPASSKTLLVIGDSISAEYGLRRDAGWVKLLDARLREQRYAYDVVNASISGETTSGGLARTDELLGRVKPEVVIIELGGNDALRGLQLDAMKTNLSTMITRAQKAGARVLLVGIDVPPNYGKPYAQRFAAVFTSLSQQYRTALAPSILAGFGDGFELFQPDRIHPTEAAQGRLLDNVWPALQPLLKK